MAVHESLRLHITTDKFYLEPTDTYDREVLVIDRISQEISLQKNEGQIPSDAEAKDIVGLLGIVRLLAGPYLVLITKKVKVGEINSQSIWRVDGTQMLCFKRTLFHLNEAQIQDNNRYVSLVEQALNMESFYFSTTYDITHTMQRLHNTSPEFLQMPLHERADVRFLWNGHLLRELAQQPELSRYCLPVMLGFIAIKPVSVKGHAFAYILISRRSCLRAGTRFYMRGVDSEGHAANYVETEQIVEYDTNRCSYVQTRGSVPLYWYQFPNLKYKPTPVISPANQADAFQRHFAAQIYNYGKQVLINLLDQKGHEEKLVKMYGAQVQQSNNTNIRYEPFDFHKECKKMRYDRLSILLERTSEDAANFGYFMTQGATVACSQDGVFRTNCIDCLDRTNVVQSLLARRCLQGQLKTLGILLPTEKVEDQAQFEAVFKNVWADNADACSKQYAGTGALKTDYTRTGKRTWLGIIKDGINAVVRYFTNNFFDGHRQLANILNSIGLGPFCINFLTQLVHRYLRTGKRTKLGLVQDGVNSLIRYILNNFYDGFRQDAQDLFLGNYTVEEAEGITKPCPLRQDKDWKFYALPAIFLVAFSMCVISILIPDEHLSEQLMYILFWGGSSAVTLGLMYYYGHEFVDRPKLAQAKLKME